MAQNYTIAESYVLPSRGLIYDIPVKAEVKIRSMTTEEEMRRQAPSDTPYKVMCDIIEECLIEKPGISVYDMCLGDYQFLLHKLRVVTYGTEYKMMVTCPNCGELLEFGFEECDCGCDCENGCECDEDCDCGCDCYGNK